MADGWMSKRAFLTLAAVLLIFLNGVFAALAALLPRLPDAMINLPRPDYWLAPERRADTLRGLQDWLLRFGAGTLMLVTLLFQLVYRANVSGTHRLGASVGWLITGYSAIAALQIAALIRKLVRHAPDKSPTGRFRRRE